jgi:hypothetical protein
MADPGACAGPAGVGRAACRVVGTWLGVARTRTAGVPGVVAGCWRGWETAGGGGV